MPDPTRPRESSPDPDIASSDHQTAASVAARVADVFGRLHIRLRARMLGRLLASVGSLALAVIGGGAFAKYITHATSEISVSLEDAARATWGQVYELVCYVQQSHPRRLQRLLDELARLGYGVA
jgi:hypothetical protein